MDYVLGKVVFEQLSLRKRCMDKNKETKKGQTSKFKNVMTIEKCQRSTIVFELTWNAKTQQHYFCQIGFGRRRKLATIWVFKTDHLL